MFDVPCTLVVEGAHLQSWIEETLIQRNNGSSTLVAGLDSLSMKLAREGRVWASLSSGSIESRAKVAANGYALIDCRFARAFAAIFVFTHTRAFQDKAAGASIELSKRGRAALFSQRARRP